MTYSPPDYANERVIERNKLPPRAYYLPESHLSLNGRWKFNYASYADLPMPKSDDKEAWSSIIVPGHWQLQGYGKPHYTNVQYPFPVDPPHIPSENPTGVYFTNFTVPEDWSKNDGYTYRLRFEGVDSAFHLFVNGTEVGYSQGSRNPAEFAIDDVLLKGSGQKNELMLKVYQWCDGSYIEDQDQWWLSGVYRDVFLLAFPKAGFVEDFTITTKFDNDYKNATLGVDVQLTLEGSVKLQIDLLDRDGKNVFETIAAELAKTDREYSIEKKVQEPLQWTAETPDLYSLRINLLHEGTAIQTVEQKVGFRQVEIKKGCLTVNGKPIILKGVNRHDHHPRYGRAVPHEFLRQDLITMKQHNVNAVRCSHYPTTPDLYQLANELGLYVMDEADLECHGFYDAIARPLDIPESMNYEERKKICFAKAAEFTSNNPSWEEAYVDRMKQLVQRDKNQPSIIIWSLGNEAFYGKNHKAMYDWSKKIDPTRPVHYEGDAEAESADMFSYMYPSVSRIVRLAENDGKPFEKPIVLCEYGHAMGTGPGALKEYQDAFEAHPRLCGGFIWEWANHGILHTDEDGKTFYGYGGDFGDEPNDGNFVMDGLCDSEHKPGPGLIEFKQVIQPVKARLEGDHIHVTNLYDFISLDHLQAFWEVVRLDSNATTIKAGILDLPSIKAGSTESISMPKVVLPLEKSGEFWLNISFKSRYPTVWDAVGSEVAWVQVPYKSEQGVPIESSRATSSLSVDSSASELKFTDSTSSFTFDKKAGVLSSWRYQDIELLSDAGGPQLNFWRAITDNDRPWDALIWQRFGVDTLTTQVRSFEGLVDDKSDARVCVKSYLTPPVLAWGFDVETNYIFMDQGAISVHVIGKPRGSMPPTLPRIGMELRLPRSQASSVKWSGRGPHQTYADMHGSARHGIWKNSLDEMTTHYEMPQENGNRTGTRWVQVLDESGNGLHATLKRSKESSSSLIDEGFDFAVHKYTSRQLDEAKHPCDLEDNDFVVLRIDAKHRGLGTGSCGPGVLTEYELPCEPFEFTIKLNPIRR